MSAPQFGADRHAFARARAAERRRAKQGRPDRRAWSGLRMREEEVDRRLELWFLRDLLRGVRA